MAASTTQTTTQTQTAALPTPVKYGLGVFTRDVLEHKVATMAVIERCLRMTVGMHIVGLESARPWEIEINVMGWMFNAQTGKMATLLSAQAVDSWKDSDHAADEAERELCVVALKTLCARLGYVVDDAKITRSTREQAAPIGFDAGTTPPVLPMVVGWTTVVIEPQTAAIDV
jgi:hypothetical protein